MSKYEEIRRMSAEDRQEIYQFAMKRSREMLATWDNVPDWRIKMKEYESDDDEFCYGNECNGGDKCGPCRGLYEYAPGSHGENLDQVAAWDNAVMVERAKFEAGKQSGYGDMDMITKERHAELLDAEALLDCLELAGVDGWDGYDDAYSDYLGLSKE